MVQLIPGRVQKGRRDPTSVVARVVQVRGRAWRGERNEAVIVVNVANRALSSSIADAVAAALHEIAKKREASVPVVRFRTERRLAELERAGKLQGATVILRVTAANATRLRGYIERSLKAGALGVQMVWDAVTPSPDRAEPFVFAALERARETPTGPPVIVARSEQPLEILELMERARRARHEEKR